MFCLAAIAGLPTAIETKYGTLKVALRYEPTQRSATGATRYHLPVPCDGSATTGRCESFLSSGIALMSNVLRVYFSKVRIPRSHRITF